MGRNTTDATLLIVLLIVLIIVLPIIIRKVMNKGADAIENAVTRKKNEACSPQEESLADRYKGMNADSENRQD